MTFDLKDIIYIIVYAVSLAGVIFSYKNRIANLESKITRLDKTLFHESGALNFISRDSCKSSQDHVYTAIRRGESNIEQTLRKIDQLNENILKIMFYLKIEKKKGDD